MENNRSNSMRQQYDAQKFPKSGFNLSNKTHVGGVVLGRIYPGGYRHCMPNDKMSASNAYALYFEQLTTPVVSDVNVIVHNFFVTYRSLHRGYEDLLTPRKQNNMSASLSAPTFSLRTIVKGLAEYIQSKNLYFFYNGTTKKLIYHSSYSTSFSTNFESLISDMRAIAAPVYIDDAITDLRLQMLPTVNAIMSLSGSSTYEEIYSVIHRFFYQFFDFFCGQGSMMDYLGYPIMKHSDIDVWLDTIVPQTIGSSTNNADFTLNSAYEVVVGGSPYMVDNTPRNEYAIRAMYAIWFDHVRIDEVEPRSANLPEYHDFTGATLFDSSSTSNLRKAIICFLPLRCNTWDADPFTTSQVDDISRHVFAPIFHEDPTNVHFSGPSMPAQENPSASLFTDVGNLWSDITLSYVDPITGSPTHISCPIPQALSSNSPLFTLNYDYPETLGLNLFSLKKAQMYERFLKRNFAFGDEYKDRMKAQYDVTIEDYSLMRPVRISSIYKPIEIKQEVANSGAAAGAGNGMVEQGSRLATAYADNKDVSDTFQFFTTEHGIYISFVSIVPRAQYDYSCPQNSIIKTMDFPYPVFSMQQEEISNTSEISRRGVINKNYDNVPFGHVPYAHGYRYNVDEVHGQMLDEKFDFTFARFYRGLTSDGVPKLNYQFVHCRPNLPMFKNKILLDGQVYGTLTHEFLVERLLPVPVESI